MFAPIATNDAPAHDEALKQLQHDVALYTHVFDTITDMILVKGERSHILYANKAFRDFYGMTLEQLRALIDAPFNDPDYTQQYVKDDAYVFSTGETLNIPTEPVTRYDGVVRHFHTVKSAYRDSNGRIVQTIGISRDITERQGVEARLHQSDSFAQAILSTIPDVMFLISDEGVYLDYKADDASQLLMPPENFLGKRIDDLLPPNLVRLLRAEMHQARFHNTLRLVEFEGPMPDGMHAYQVRIKPMDGEKMVIMMRDVTESKQAEAERLRLQEEVIQAQSAALAELSTPLIPLSENVVVMPLIGSIDSRRAQNVLQVLLSGVTVHNARVAILDITGVSVVDTQVASALLRAAQAVRLLGAQVVLTGIRPEVAQTLVALGADFSTIVTRGTLQSGIAYALGQ